MCVGIYDEGDDISINGINWNVTTSPGHPNQNETILLG